MLVVDTKVVVSVGHIPGGHDEARPLVNVLDRVSDRREAHWEHPFLRETLRGKFPG